MGARAGGKAQHGAQQCAAVETIECNTMRNLLRAHCTPWHTARRAQRVHARADCLQAAALRPAVHASRRECGADRGAAAPWRGRRRSGRRATHRRDACLRCSKPNLRYSAIAAALSVYTCSSMRRQPSQRSATSSSAAISREPMPWRCQSLATEMPMPNACRRRSAGDAGCSPALPTMRASRFGHQHQVVASWRVPFGQARSPALDAGVRQLQQAAEHLRVGHQLRQALGVAGAHAADRDVGHDSPPESMAGPIIATRGRSGPNDVDGPRAHLQPLGDPAAHRGQRLRQLGWRRCHRPSPGRPCRRPCRRPAARRS